MKNISTLTVRVLCCLLVLCLGLGASACRKSHTDTHVSHYTCPMHPQIREDAPGSCPICGMDLVPVKKTPAKTVAPEPAIPAAHYTCPMHPQVHDDEPGSCPMCGMDLVKVEAPQAPAAQQAHAGMHIDPQHVQNIGVTTATAELRTITRDITAYGKVAHDPKLWVAQNEFIEALKLGDRSLIQSAELKLQFLGLSADWIALLRKERTADLGLHLPSADASGYFEVFVHQGDVQAIHVKQRVDVLDAHGDVMEHGTIAAIGTMVDPNTRLLRALVRADNPVDFKSNTFVQVRIHVELGERLTVPRSAVLLNGDHNLVYRMDEGSRFSPIRVELGKSNDDYYEVLRGVQAGDRVVTNGHFLIDSETQIKGGGSHDTHQH